MVAISSKGCPRNLSGGYGKVLTRDAFAFGPMTVSSLLRTVVRCQCRGRRSAVQNRSNTMRDLLMSRGNSVVLEGKYG